MSIMPGIWVNENVSVGNGAGQLLHLTSEGVRYADGASAAVAEWGRQARSGNFDTIPEHFFRVPWSTIEWMEWSHGLDIRFHCASPGMPGITLTYEALSDEQRDEITQRLRAVGVHRPSERRQSTFEIVRNPAGVMASVLVVAVAVAYFVGQEASGGASRSGARIRLFTLVANTLGYGGIGAIALVIVASLGAYIAFRLRNPPVVHRLELAT